MKKINFLMLFLLTISFTSQSSDLNNIEVNSIVKINAPNIYPEGIAWSEKSKKIFISSVADGIVRSLSSNGKLEKFINDPNIISSVGLLVDDKKGILWVANSDTGGSSKSSSKTLYKYAGVGKYDLSTGSKIAYYDLGKLSPGNHMANDISMDSNGFIYITDSFSPTLWSISPEGKPSIYLQDQRFYSGNGYNLNGIVTLEDNSIIVGNSLSGEIFKLSGEKHKKITKIKLKEKLKTLDGLRLSSSGSLFVVKNIGINKNHGEVVELISNDNWISAKVVSRKETIDSMPTTAANISGETWVLNAQLDKLLFSKTKPKKVESYILQKIN